MGEIADTYETAVKEWEAKLGDQAWIGYDLDGSAAHYDSWKGHLVIGRPIPESIRKIRAYLNQGYKVKIFTARMSVPEHAEEVAKVIAAWTLKHVGVALEATCQKDYACIRIYDDRAEKLVPNTGFTELEFYLNNGEKRK